MLKALPPDVRKEMGIRIDRGRPRKVIDQDTGLVKTIDDFRDAFRPNAVHMKFKGRDQ
jgi:hypothetical protein